MINLLPADYEVYFDDSGTDDKSPVAIAACYVATKDQWDHFTRNWNEIKKLEGFEYFHMTDFMCDQRAGVKPYCEWDEDKRKRVYRKLSTLITIRARMGFALTVGKKDYDELIPEEMRKYGGRSHYVWAARILMGDIARWRAKWGIKRPMQYVFSETPKGKGTRGEILDLMDELKDNPLATEEYGLVKDGLGFQDMRVFPPLQAADILAWNMLDHHLNVMTVSDKDDVRDCSRWFRQLRQCVGTNFGFLTRKQMEEFSQRIEDHKNKTGRYPHRRVERLLRKEARRKLSAAQNQRVREVLQDGGTANDSSTQQRQNATGRGESKERKKTKI